MERRGLRPHGESSLLGCLCTNLNCKARNTPVDKTGVNFTDCSQGVLRTVDAPPLLSRLNGALESIRCCEKEPCEIQTCQRCELEPIGIATWSKDTTRGSWHRY